MDPPPPAPAPKAQSVPTTALRPVCPPKGRPLRAFGGGALSRLPGEARGAGGGATHRSEASSLLMYSSRMLVSMLEGSRAPLMSWPAGRSGCEPGQRPSTHRPLPVSTWRESPSQSPPAAPPAGRDTAVPSPQGPLDSPRRGGAHSLHLDGPTGSCPSIPSPRCVKRASPFVLSIRWGERVPILWGAVSSK